MKSDRLLAALFTAGAAIANQQAQFGEEGRARFSAQVAYDDLAPPEVVAMDLPSAPPTIFSATPVQETDTPQDAVEAISQDWQAQLEAEKAARKKLFDEANAKLLSAREYVKQVKTEAEKRIKEAETKAAKPAPVQQHVPPVVVPTVQEEVPRGVYQPQTWYYSYPQSGGCVNGQCNR